MICTVLGFIALICMILIAVYKSKQQKHVLESSPKRSEGIISLLVHWSSQQYAYVETFQGQQQSW